MTGPEPVRLSLDPDLARRGAVDGAWWPASYDAGAELPALIAAIDQRLERRVLRVGLHVDTWDNIPRRIAAPGRQIRVGWFRTIDPHLINLIIPGIEHLNLLVIPPGTAPAAAGKALGLATRCRGRTRPGDILTAADPDNPTTSAPTTSAPTTSTPTTSTPTTSTPTASAPAGLDTAANALGLAGWENEGGQPRQPARRRPAP